MNRPKIKWCFEWPGGSKPHNKAPTYGRGDGYATPKQASAALQHFIDRFGKPDAMPKLVQFEPHTRRLGTELTALEHETIQACHRAKSFAETAQILQCTHPVLWARIDRIRRKNYPLQVASLWHRECGWCGTSIDHRSLLAKWCEDCRHPRDRLPQYKKPERSKP